MSVWVLAADSSRARIFSEDKPNSPLQEITDLIQPEARLHDAELTADTDNRGRSPKGIGSHGSGDAPEIKDELASQFAAQICGLLETAQSERKFHKLYIVAAPAFLGMLRKYRTPNTEKLIAGEVAKNLCAHTMEDIRKHLPKKL